MIAFDLIGVALDPGLHETAMVTFGVDLDAQKAAPWGVQPVDARMLGNEDTCEKLFRRHGFSDVLIVEAIAGLHGPSSGRDQIATERWGGEMIRSWRLGKVPERPHHLVTSSTARAATTGRVRKIGDPQVRAALVDMYGGKERAFGVKCQPCKSKGWRGRGRSACGECNGAGWTVPKGPLHGWTGSHVFRALAVAIAAFQPGGIAHQKAVA